MFKKFFVKSTLSAVLMSMMMSAAPMPVSADTYVVEGGGSLLLVLTVLGVTTTLTNRRHYDSSKAESLIDQAYQGSGDRLDVLATGMNKSVEDVADAIIALDKAGKISPSNPEQMAQAIATVLK